MSDVIQGVLFLVFAGFIVIYAHPRLPDDIYTWVWFVCVIWFLVGTFLGIKGVISLIGQYQ